MDNRFLTISVQSLLLNKFLPITFTFLLSCTIAVDSNSLDKDSQEIYSLSLDETTGSDTIHRYHLRIPPLPPPLPDADKEDILKRIQFQKWKDSVKASLLEVELFVIVNHKIDTLANSDLLTIRQIFFSNQSEPQRDTSFNAAIRELCNNKLMIDTLDPSKLHTTFNYKIYADREFPKDKFRKIGSVSFSKIAFSKDRSKAVVCASFFCGGLCGYGKLLFFEKPHGTWEFKNSRDLWVS